MSAPRRPSPRLVEVVLTEAQYDALAGAVALREVDLDDRIEDGDRAARIEAGALRRGWGRLNGAWHEAGR